jgi:hypothetical protein
MYNKHICFLTANNFGTSDENVARHLQDDIMYYRANAFIYMIEALKMISLQYIDTVSRYSLTEMCINISLGISTLMFG